MSFSSSPNFQFTILEQFLKFKTCKFVEIDAIGIEVAKQIKMSGCPIKGHFTAKNVYLPLLAVKWPYQLGFHMRYRFFILHCSWFLQNLEKTSFQHLCTRLYSVYSIIFSSKWMGEIFQIISHLYHRTVHTKRLSCDPQNHD